MRRLTLAFAACMLVIAGAVAAWASHVDEPMSPIIDFTLRVENYADNFPTDCQGSALRPKVRLENVAWGTFERFQNGDPSEHFAVGVILEQRTTNPKTGQFLWSFRHEYAWDHQNIPPHNDSIKFNVGYATTDPNVPNGGTSLLLTPGYYRITSKLLTHETDVHYVRICEFTITAA